MKILFTMLLLVAGLSGALAYVNTDEFGTWTEVCGDCPLGPYQACPSAADWNFSVFLPNAADEHYFFHCIDTGEKWCKRCPGDLFWNQNLETCDYYARKCFDGEKWNENKVKCEHCEFCTQSIMCSDNDKPDYSRWVNSINIPCSAPDEDGCRDYNWNHNGCTWDCVDGFVRSGWSCVWDGNGIPPTPDCVPGNSPACPPGDGIFFPHRDPRCFYHCSNSTAHRFMCQAHTCWNADEDSCTTFCDWPGR
jgi:hypothetical protein